MNRTYALIGYAVAGVIISIACDMFAGRPFSNKMCGFCVLMPICLLIQERYIAYEVPDASIADRVLPAIPGIVIVMLILEGIHHLVPEHNITIAVTAAIVFVTLLYPMVLKYRMRRSGSGSAAGHE